MSAPVPVRAWLLLAAGGLFFVPALLLGGWAALAFLDPATARTWALAAARPLGIADLVDLALRWPWAVGIVAALLAFYALHFVNDGWRAVALARTGREAPDPMAAAGSILAAVVLGVAGVFLGVAAFLTATDPGNAVRLLASLPGSMPARDFVDELAEDLPMAFGAAALLLAGAWLEARAARFALHPEKRRRGRGRQSLIDPPQRSFNGRQT